MNNTVTQENVCQHVAVLRTEFKNFNKKMNDVSFKVNHIYDSMPETVRKVNKHHETYAGDQIKIAKIEPIEQRVMVLEKQNPANDNGEERRKGTWRRMVWWKKLSIIGAIIAVLFRPEIRDIIIIIFKTYFNIE